MVKIRNDSESGGRKYQEVSGEKVSDLGYILNMGETEFSSVLGIECKRKLNLIIISKIFSLTNLSKIFINNL